MDVLNVSDIKRFMGNMSRIVQENKDWLTQLDGEIGDGDLGLTMTKGFGRVEETLVELDEDDIGKVLMKAGMTMASAVPSTMGTLMATGFMRGGKTVAGKTEVDLGGLANFFEAFVNGIMERGKAQPGDKTIIDSLKPAADSLRESINHGRTLVDGVDLAYQASVQGLELTKEMVSQHGKAACFQEKTLGKQDPGATVGMLLIRALAQTIQGQ